MVYTHTRVHARGVCVKRNGVHRNEIYEGRGDLLEERHVRTRELSFEGGGGGGGMGEEGGKKRGSNCRHHACVYAHTFTRVHSVLEVSLSMRRDKRTRGDTTTTTSLKNVAGGKK